MHGRGRPQPLYRGHQWQRLSIVAVTSLLLVGFRCPPDVWASVPGLFDRIEQEFLDGKFKLAQSEFSTARDLIAHSGPDWIEQFNLQHAKVTFYQGHSSEALKIILENPGTPATPNERAVGRDTLLSMVYARLGDFKHARLALAEAERRAKDSACYDLMQARGFLARTGGGYEDAERFYSLTLAGARAAGQRHQQSETLLNLGVVSLRQEHYEDALDRFGQALQLAESIGAQSITEKVTGSAAFAFYKLGDFQKALASAEEAEKQAEELGVLIDQARWLNDEGLYQVSMGDLQNARRLFERSFELADQIKNDEETVDAQVALGYLSVKLDSIPSALAHARQAKETAAVHLDVTQQIQPALLEALSLAKLNQLNDSRNDLLALRLIATKPSDRWKVEYALAQLAVQTGDKREADRRFQQAIETFDRQRGTIHELNSKLPFLENGTDLYLGYVDQLISQGRTGEALAVLDRSRAETLIEGLGLTPSLPPAKSRQPSPIRPETASVLHATALARRLNGTILVYCLRPHTSYLWAISPSQTKFLRLPGQADILAQFERQRSAILVIKDLLADDSAPGRALYDLLVRPAQDLIPAKGKVFIVSDEALRGLNFETLITSGEAPHFWIEDVTLTNAASLTLLNARGGNKPDLPASLQERRLLLIGDSNYAGTSLSPLENASREIANISRHFAPDRQRVFTGAQAFPAVYGQSDPAKYSFIQFVAHATANESDPLDSAVILSPEPGLADTNKLYAKDILAHPISAELVTISGCFGSGSRIFHGEGLVGLAWAFLRAGSHNVIASLWEVSDADTPDFMDHLYDGLGTGATPDVALRSAKLTMLHSSGTSRKPYYWAPFQLYSGA